MLDAASLGHRDGHAEAARLEAARRVDALFLDAELGKADAIAEGRRREQRCVAFAEVDAVRRVLDRQHLGIPPQGGLAQLEMARPHVLRRALEIVASEQRRATLAEVEQPVLGAGGPKDLRRSYSSGVSISHKMASDLTLT